VTFTPARWARGPHLQTIVPTLYPLFGAEPLSEILDVAVAEGTSVRTLVSRAPGGRRGTIVLVHGLGGSGSGVYMIRTARAALSRGWSVVRMNLRNCGGTERLARTLYNAGQSDDLARVLHGEQRFELIEFDFVQRVDFRRREGPEDQIDLLEPAPFGTKQ
jgi:hypothetical protein